MDSVGFTTGQLILLLASFTLSSIFCLALVVKIRKSHSINQQTLNNKLQSEVANNSLIERDIDKNYKNDLALSDDLESYVIENIDFLKQSMQVIQSKTMTLEHQIEKFRPLMTTRQSPNKQSVYQLAIQRAQEGACIEELSKDFTISPSEAELLIFMHANKR